MVLIHNIKIKKVEAICIRCNCILFEYYTIGNKVKNFTLKKSYKETSEGNICYRCYNKENPSIEKKSKLTKKQKKLLKKIDPLRKALDNSDWDDKESDKIVNEIEKVLKKNG